jgi:hypothetical protein
VATRILCDFFVAIMPWGNWLTIKLAQLYVADETYVVGPLARELFDLCRDSRSQGSGT